MRVIVWIGLLFIAGSVAAQDDFSSEEVVEVEVPEEAVAEVELEIIPVAIEMVNKSWFTDRVGTALIYFETEVEQPETLPEGIAGVNFIDIAVQLTPGSERGESVAVVRFILKETGLVTFPSLDFSAAERIYRSAPQQVLVGEPVQSEAMELTLVPAKRQVYVGEPLRVDLSWRCDLDPGRLQALNYYPEFFNDSRIEVIIPRNSAPENKQVGIPVGGRRAIGNRVSNKDKSRVLGTLELTIFLRLSEAGTYVLPATRLECAHRLEGSRNFGQYAAHFNNNFFDPEGTEERYERFYTETESVEIEVLPLPESGRSPGFSGLFEPVQFEVSVEPNTVEVGQIMEVEVQVTSDAPHGMLDLPKLSRQRGLRGRFLVDDQLDRLWHAGGTTFRSRVRGLTSDISAFPELRIQTFDTETGDYVTRTTAPVPLIVNSSEGQSYIDLSAYSGTRVSLVGQPEGIWHNLEANVMNDLLNKVVLTLASWFWFLVLLGPVAFAVLLPFVRERRRRALDLEYRERMEAFAAFQKLPENSVEKWSAFLQFLSVSFKSNERAWTVEDSRIALESVNAPSEDVEQVLTLHRLVDAEEFHPDHPEAKRRDLNAIGKRILDLIGKGALVLLVCTGLNPNEANASNWSEAEVLFTEAINAEAGSEAAAALYAESALKFEAAAESGNRPGIAWYNAGNAWFKTGALGRSIAAYREARVYRPFDSLLEDNLLAARALTLNDVPMEGSSWSIWPSVWLKALFVIVALTFWILLLLYLRYRKRSLFVLCILSVLLALGSALFLVYGLRESGKYGVVVLDEVIARKGPAYSYARAFGGPLHDGLEFTLIESRGEWGLIVLPDTRECWVVLSQVQLLSH